jgi:serine/threonine protein kinase
MRSMDVIANRYLVVKGPGEDPSLKGGMGSVYLCADQAEDGRPVALKTFHQRFLSDRGVRDRFLRECDIWVQLGRHPHIVRAHQVLHVGDGREMYMVSDWVAAAEGKRSASLREWLTPGRPLDVNRALRWALQIARAMKHASRKVPGLVHCDLKPENVLVGREGRARVTDFGLAKVLAEARTIGENWTAEGDAEHSAIRHTQVTARWVGTPEYMAPEQWEDGAVDLRTDVYAWGCLVVEMLTGEMPVRSKRREDCRALHGAGRALEVAEAAQPELRRLLAGCVSVRLDDRYCAWDRVQAELETVYEHLTQNPASPEASVDQETREERVAAGYSLNAIGVSYLSIGKFWEAAGYFERALRIGREEHEPALEGAGLGNLGNAYRNLGQPRQAVVYFDQHLAITREMADETSEGAALGNLGNAYRQLGEPHRAIDYQKQHLTIARETADWAAEARALGNLGNAYQDLGEPRAATGYYEQNLAISRKIGDRVGEGRVQANLGSAYLQLGEPRRAVEHLEQALVIAREVGDRKVEGATLCNLGNVCRQLEPRMAVAYLDQAVVIMREIGDRHGEGAALGSLGNAYRDLRELEQARGYYSQALAIASEIGDRMGEAKSSFNLARLFIQQGDLQSAWAHTEAAARGFHKTADQLWRQLGGPSRRDAPGE